MTINKLTSLPQKLQVLKKPPIELYYIGNNTLLDNFIIAIIGTRKPNQYTKDIMPNIIRKLSKKATIISGGAIGVDTLAHQNSLPNTIMVSPSSLETIYPKQNKRLIEQISKEALIISEYERDYLPHRYSFLERNRIIIALSDIVILPQGNLYSGSNASANMALELNKPIFVLPHRQNESTLTNYLLENNKASAIYNVDNFITSIFGECQECEIYNDEVLKFCNDNPTFDEALLKFGDKLLEYEFMGLIKRIGNKVTISGN